VKNVTELNKLMSDRGTAEPQRVKPWEETLSERREINHFTHVLLAIPKTKLGGGADEEVCRFARCSLQYIMVMIY